MAKHFKSISLISLPYHCGTPNVGIAKGPGFLKGHGLLAAAQSFGLPVQDIEIPGVEDYDGEAARQFELHRRTARAVAQQRNNKSFPIILSGNCGASVGVAAGLTAGDLSGKSLGCVWFDAHDDLHTPDTFTSGYGDSMAIAMLAGNCYKKLLQTIPGHEPLDLKNLVHVGLRDVTDAERVLVADAGIDVVWGNDQEKVDFVSELDATLKRKHLGDSMIHVDVDSLDASVGKFSKFATYGGLLPDELAGCLVRTASATRPVSLTVASFDPAGDGAENVARAVVESVRKFLEAVLSS